jgi:hypothetical protein
MLTWLRFPKWLELIDWSESCLLWGFVGKAFALVPSNGVLVVSIEDPSQLSHLDSLFGRSLNIQITHWICNTA